MEALIISTGVVALAEIGDTGDGGVCRLALTDADRAEWLHALSAILAEARDQHQGVVVACSALKKAYRNILRQGAADALPSSLPAIHVPYIYLC